MSGFFTIQRDLFNHEIFATEPMSEREAFMWMISRASWSDTRHRVGAEMVDVPRGSFMVTLRELQSKFMWKSDKRVRNFLAMLEGENMIERAVRGQRNAPKTHVTICNYNKYQTPERTEDAPKTHQRRTKDAVKNKNNKTTTVTNVTKRDEIIEILTRSVSLEMAVNFYEFREELKKPMTPRSAVAIVGKLKGHHDPNGVLNNSIANSWQGIFPDKTPKLMAINGGQQNGQSTNNNTNRLRRVVTRAAAGTSGQDWG